MAAPHPPLPKDEASGSATRAGIAGWLLFDWAAQPFFTLVTTFVYAPYFASAVARDPVSGQAMWGFATSAAGLVIALLSPALGAVADAGGRRKPWIAVFGAMLVIGCALLWLGRPGDAANVVPVLVAFALATIGAEFATVFNNAMMSSLVPPHRLGRLSGTGWAAGYIGGLISLVLTLGWLAANPQTGLTLFGIAPLFDLDPAQREGDRFSGPLSAMWFAVFVLPMFLFTPDRPRGLPLRSAIRAGLSALRTTLRDLPTRRDARIFLIANLIYADGLAALFAFGGIYAAGVFGWATIQIGLFGILLTITGTIGAWLGGKLDDRLGPRVVIASSLLVLVLGSLALLSIDAQTILFVFPVDPPQAGAGLFNGASERMYLLVGAIIGLVVGPVQAASRTMLVRVAPSARLTQYFGLFALSGKVTSFLGPLAVSTLTTLLASQRAGMAVLVAFFAVGLVLILRLSAGNAASR